MTVVVVSPLSLLSEGGGGGARRVILTLKSMPLASTVTGTEIVLPQTTKALLLQEAGTLLVRTLDSKNSNRSLETSQFLPDWSQHMVAWSLEHWVMVVVVSPLLLLSEGGGGGLAAARAIKAKMASFV